MPYQWYHWYLLQAIGRQSSAGRITITVYDIIQSSLTALWIGIIERSMMLKQIEKKSYWMKCLISELGIQMLDSAVSAVYQLDMCLWNTDAPGGNKVKIWQNL